MTGDGVTGRASRSSDRMLGGSWDLVFVETGETVHDVEALIRGVLGAEGWPAFLEPADEAELVATLLGDAVLLERKYQRRAGIEARPWLFERLRFKARDWRRVKLRHPVTGDLPGALSNFDNDGIELTEPGRDRRAGLGDGSHGAPGEVAGDRGDPGRDALRELLESGDRALLREVAALGLSAPPGARGRTPEARAALRRLDRTRAARVAALDQPVGVAVAA